MEPTFTLYIQRVGHEETALTFPGLKPTELTYLISKIDPSEVQTYAVTREKD
jgi:hypothetical protein